MTQFSTIVEKIVAQTQDYENCPITPEHIGCWLTQFPEQEHGVLLRGVHRMVVRHYYSKERCEAAWDDLSRQLAEKLTQRSVHLWDLHQAGGSQSHFTPLFAAHLRKLGFTIEPLSQSDDPQTIVYVDDALFTGNTLFQSLKANHERIKAAQLHLIYLQVHTAGRNYVRGYVDKQGIKASLLGNSAVSTYQECLWPKAPSAPLPYQSEFAQRIHSLASAKGGQPRLFRPENSVGSGWPEDNRYQFEQILLRRGLEIICAYRNSKDNGPSLRPMGYEVLQSWGFGAQFMTYRNIANNCPLALWWGSVDQYNSNSRPLLPAISANAKSTGTALGSLFGDIARWQ